MPFPPPEDLPDPGFELASLATPALAGRFFTTVPPGKSRGWRKDWKNGKYEEEKEIGKEDRRDTLKL